MIILRNPYEGIWEKHRSIDDMDMILESRTGGTDYGRLSVLSATANDEQPLRTDSLVGILWLHSRQAVIPMEKSIAL